MVYKSYNMGTHGLPDIYTLALGPAALGHRVYNYIRQTTLALVITYTYDLFVVSLDLI